MHLAPPNDQRLSTLFNWFDDNQSVAIWGGPDMRLPMTLETLKVDAKLDSLASHFLIDNDNSVLGFGQFYQRISHCHLGRLVVAPGQRGRGLGRKLIDKLSEEGFRTLKLATQSLFVVEQNVRAKELYVRLGFVQERYPGTDIDPSNFLYMVRK